MKKIILGAFFLLFSTCLLAQRKDIPYRSSQVKPEAPKAAPAKSNADAKPETQTPKQENPKPGTSPERRDGTESKSNAVVFKGKDKAPTGRDVDNIVSRDGAAKGGAGGRGETGNGGAGKGKTTTKTSTQRDRPKDIPF